MKTHLTAWRGYSRIFAKLIPMKARRAAMGALAIAIVCCPLSLAAADYPTKPIQIVVPLAAGGPGDVLMRIIADKMSEPLGQRLVIENRPGAGSNIGFGAVARAPADGYTLLLALQPFTVNPSVFKTVPYDPIKDFVPISRVLTLPLVIAAHPSVPATTLSELIAYIKTKPGELNFGSSGLGSTPHLAAILMDEVAGTQMTHVPYSGIPAAMTDLITNRIQVVIAGPPVVMPFFKEGKLKAFAVTSKERSSAAPELPTAREAGLTGYEMTTWYGLLAPAGTPAEVITKVRAALDQALKNPQVKQRLVEFGADPAFDVHASAFADDIARDVRYWRDRAKVFGSKIE